MTLKEKWKHIWLYYKWYILAGAVLVLLLANHIAEVSSRAEPDYEVAIVTGGYVTEGTRQQLAETLAELWPDTDGDGQVKINVNFYQYDAETAQATDPAAFMAGAVQLAADFEMRMSVCFLSDNPELLLDNDVLESYGPIEESALTELTELAGFALVGYRNSAPVGLLFE